MQTVTYMKKYKQNSEFWRGEQGPIPESITAYDAIRFSRDFSIRFYQRSCSDRITSDHDTPPPPPPPQTIRNYSLEQVLALY